MRRVGFKAISLIANNMYPTSTTKTIWCGLPQVFILGPLSFFICINDLYHVCDNCTPILFADDTHLFINGIDTDHKQSLLNTELAHISEWLIADKLSLKVKKKPHYIVFLTKKRVTRNVLTIKINGQAINEVNKTKFIGVIIDKKINWKDHFQYIADKVSRGVGRMIKARQLS